MNLIGTKIKKIKSVKSFKNINLFNILAFLKKKLEFSNLNIQIIKKIIYFFYNRNYFSSFNYFNYKLKLFKQLFNKNIFKFIYKSLVLVKTLNNSKILYNNFYKDKFNKCAIVKAYLNFTNTFVLLTNLKGEIKHWVSAGTGGFKTKIERFSPQVPISLCFRISNVIRRKKYKHIKIEFNGPSKKFRSKIYYTLKNRSWIRKFKISLLKENYLTAYNGCRLAK